MQIKQLSTSNDVIARPNITTARPDKSWQKEQASKIKKKISPEDNPNNEGDDRKWRKYWK
jgi:hypothetical protein